MSWIYDQSMSKENEPQAEAPALPRNPIKLLQDFLDREGIILTTTSEAVNVGDGSMLVKPRISVNFKVQ